MRSFDTNVQELKYKVLKEVVRLVRKKQFHRGYYDIPRKLIPGPKATMRCCIYRERAIVQERVKLATGGTKNNSNVIEVIDSACDECPVTRYRVTDTCRKCIAHKCYAVCPVDAIHFENKKAVIDPDKCIGCGRCMKECPYNAIIESHPPCIGSCKAKAISLNSDKKAEINNEKCTRCGACVYTCPFGAIVDKSYLLDVFQLLAESDHGQNFKIYAAVAPSIAGQFKYAKIEQVVTGIKQLGFYGVVEVASGADTIAQKEAKELAEKGFLISSCCPSFVKYVQINFPDMVQHISHNVSPMVAVAQSVKRTDPTAKVVFIGPCIAKKMEFKNSDIASAVDSVLTFEELQAFLDGMDITIENLPETALSDASYHGRLFARTGGVSAAIAHQLEVAGLDFEVKSEVCNGIDQCKTALMKAVKGNLEKNFIEGMACEGGCIGGPACLNHSLRKKMEVEAYAQEALGSKQGPMKYLMSSAK